MPEDNKKPHYPRGPRIVVDVTQELIDAAVPKNSSHCMIADSIKAAYPNARRVSVDISTCRLSDPTRGLHYTYLTPRIGQVQLVDFDEGVKPAPFKFLLQRPHVTKIRRKKESSEGKRVRRAALVATHTGVVSRRVGGDRPPQLHQRREFGIRAFRGGPRSEPEASPPSS